MEVALVLKLSLRCPSSSRFQPLQPLLCDRPLSHTHLKTRSKYVDHQIFNINCSLKSSTCWSLPGIVLKSSFGLFLILKSTWRQSRGACWQRRPPPTLLPGRAIAEPRRPLAGLDAAVIARIFTFCFLFVCPTQS